MSIHAPGRTSSIEDRALSLLGSGLGPETVASALGITVSRVSQLLSDEQFSLQVATLRYEALQAHNKRDLSYDAIEDKLLEKLSNVLPFMVKPQEILGALRIINNAKRRGTSSPAEITNKQQIVNITLPTVIKNTFIMNGDNQVVQAGTQELVTIQSSVLAKQVAASNNNNDTPNPAHRQLEHLNETEGTDALNKRIAAFKEKHALLGTH